jgi:hydroxyacyl-ACP dehydratase HTD2-like protein with hotdog domain
MKTQKLDKPKTETLSRTRGKIHHHRLESPLVAERTGTIVPTGGGVNPSRRLGPPRFSFHVPVHLAQTVEILITIADAKVHVAPFFNVEQTSKFCSRSIHFVSASFDFSTCSCAALQRDKTLSYMAMCSISTICQGEGDKMTLTPSPSCFGACSL